MALYKVQSTYPKFDWDDVENIDSLVDDLERESIARAIAVELRGGARPRIMGIYGWWGAGKSYLLSLVARQIFADNQEDKNLQILVCTFNPWRYELEGNLAPGLITAMHNLEKQFNGRQSKSLADNKEYKSVAKQLLNLVLEVSPIILPSQPVVAIASKAIAKGMEVTEHTAKAEDESSVHTVDKIQGQMQLLVNSILDAAYKQIPLNSIG
jgi:predicted KAP-like P-loop ATPase